MIARLALAIFVGIVVYLLSYIVLGLLSLPVSPYAALLGILAGILSFFRGYV